MIRSQHPSERGFDFPTPGPARPSQSRLIESATRFGIAGIGTSESKSLTTTTDQKSSTGDEGVLSNISGVSKSTVVGGASTLVQGSKILDDSVLLEGSSQLGGARTGAVGAGGTVVGGDLLTAVLDFAGARIGDDIDNSVDLGGARIGDDTQTTIGNVTVNDGKLLTDTMDYFAAFAKGSEKSRDDTLGGILELTKLTEKNRAAADANTGETLAEMLDAVADSKTAADPDAQKNKTILWIVLATLAFLFFRK